MVKRIAPLPPKTAPLSDVSVKGASSKPSKEARHLQDSYGRVPPQDPISRAIRTSGPRKAGHFIFDAAGISRASEFVKEAVSYLQTTAALSVDLDLRKNGTLTVEAFRQLIDLPWIRAHLPQFFDEIFAGECGLHFKLTHDTMAPIVRLLYQRLATLKTDDARATAQRMESLFGRSVPLKGFKFTPTGKALRESTQWTVSIPGESRPVFLQMEPPG